MDISWQNPENQQGSHFSLCTFCVVGGHQRPPTPSC